MPDFDVVDLGRADHPQPGDEAPDFTRPLVNREFWEDRTLSEFTGDSAASDGRVVLVFTSMIGSFVGEYVYDELRERGWNDRDATVLGVTASTPYAIARFLEEEDLPFAVFADPANGVAESYAIAHDLDGMTGVSEPRLAFFAIEDGTVEAAWVATEWPEFPDYDELEDRLGLA